MYTTKKTTTKTQNRCFADDFLFHNASFRFFSPILMNNCPSVGVGRTSLPFPITVQPTFQGTFHIPAWKSSNQFFVAILRVLMTFPGWWKLTNVTQTQRLANRDRPNDLELMGDRHVSVRKIIQTANLPFGGDMRRSVYQLVKLGDKQTSTFNGGKPYNGYIKPLLLGWWVYPLFNMILIWKYWELIDPLLAHIS